MTKTEFDEMFPKEPEAGTLIVFAINRNGDNAPRILAARKRTDESRGAGWSILGISDLVTWEQVEKGLMGDNRTVVDVYTPLDAAAQFM